MNASGNRLLRGGQIGRRFDYLFINLEFGFGQKLVEKSA
jgi:hypothetical protein